MNNGLVRTFAAMLGSLALIAASTVHADGTTERERTMSRYKNCEWTDAMSKEIYDASSATTVLARTGVSMRPCR